MPEEPLQSRLQSSPSCSLPSRPSRGRRSRAPLRHSLPHPAAPVQHQPQPRSAGRRRALRWGSRTALGRTGWPAPMALGGSRGCAPEDAKSALEFLSTRPNLLHTHPQHRVRDIRLGPHVLPQLGFGHQAAGMLG